MSFSTIAALVSGKRPVWLYDVTFGTTKAHYTTKAGGYNNPGFDFFSETNFFSRPDFFTLPYTALPITRGKIAKYPGVKKSTVDVTFPRSEALAQTIRDNYGAQTTEIVITKLYDNDPVYENVVMFRGRIVGVKPNIATITFSCEDSFTTMRRKILAAVLQSPCRHAHYFDPGADFAGCKLNIANFLVGGTVSAYSGNVLTVAEAANYDDGYFSAGTLVYGSTKQMILSHTGSKLTMLMLPDGLATALAGGSQAIQMAPGCNLTLQMCSATFQNVENYGGFPFAADNPYNGRNPY